MKEIPNVSRSLVNKYHTIEMEVKGVKRSLTERNGEDNKEINDDDNCNRKKKNKEDYVLI